ncbi:MAG: hypothetical protein IPM29_04555 [Planctomycetes bacterium]|nr:hypothetical protein [Planctomycetota bacterium]
MGSGFHPTELRRVLGVTFDNLAGLRHEDDSTLAQFIAAELGSRPPQSEAELRSRVWDLLGDALGRRLAELAEPKEGSAKRRDGGELTTREEQTSRAARNVARKLRLDEVRFHRAFPEATDAYLQNALDQAHLDDERDARRHHPWAIASQLGDPDQPDPVAQKPADEPKSDRAEVSIADVGQQRDALRIVSEIARLHGQQGTAVADVANELHWFIRDANARVVLAGGRPRDLPAVAATRVFDDPDVRAEVLRYRAQSPVRMPLWRLVENPIGIAVDDELALPATLQGFAVWYAGALVERGLEPETLYQHQKRFREALARFAATGPSREGLWIVEAVVDGETPFVRVWNRMRSSLPVQAHEPGENIDLLRQLRVVDVASDEAVRTLAPRDHALALRLRDVRGPSNQAVAPLAPGTLARDLGVDAAGFATRIDAITDALHSAAGGRAWTAVVAERLLAAGQDPISTAGSTALLWEIAAQEERFVGGLDESVRREARAIRSWIDDQGAEPSPPSIALMREVGHAIHAAPGGWQCWCDLNRLLLSPAAFAAPEPESTTQGLLAALWTLQVAGRDELASFDGDDRRLVALVRGGALEACAAASEMTRTRINKEMVPPDPSPARHGVDKRKATESARRGFDEGLDGRLIDLAGRVQ